jgi:hypothetical protein
LGSERAGESFPSRAVGFGGFCAVHGWAAWGGLGAFGAMPGAAHSQHHRPPIQHTTPSTVYPVAQLQHQHYSVGLRHSICWSRCRCRCSPATPIARNAPMPAAIHQPGSYHPAARHGHTLAGLAAGVGRTWLSIRASSRVLLPPDATALPQRCFGQGDWPTCVTPLSTTLHRTSLVSRCRYSMY